MRQRSLIRADLKTISLLPVIAILVLAGCGGDDGASESDRGGTDGGVAATGPTGVTEPRKDRAPAREGIRVILADSDFGRMLFDSKRQAIYIFERDERNKSNCYGECAEAWPPVFTKGDPRAGDGVKSSLLGTTKRRDGRLQVTYAGKPLYFYAHEGPGEVKCHNVNLNGGFWWAVGADGERLQ
jgi:predicted lipoprotein with Yx(FWY)xxD motif